MYQTRWLTILALLAAFSVSAPARADYWFQVADASQLQFLTDGHSRVFLRNLNTFDPTVLGCCFNYWIDLSTDAGKAAWATLLAKIEAHEPVWLYLYGAQSQTVASLVLVGNFG